MKKIFTLLSLCLPLFVFSQTFQLEPSEDIYQEHLVNEYSGDVINVRNISSEIITVNYETLSNTFLDDWGCSFCAGDGCYNHIPVTETLGQIEPDKTSFLNCSLFFGDYPGEGTVVFKIFDVDNPSIADTISLTYKVTAEMTNTNDFANEYNFEVNPNPTTGFLNISNDQLEQYQVNVYTMTGQMILNEKVSGKSWSGDLANHNGGMYILTVRGENGLIFRQKISKL